MVRILVKTSVVNIDKKFLHRTKKYATDTLNTTSKRAKFTVKGDKPNDSDRVKKKTTEKAKERYIWTEKSQQIIDEIRPTHVITSKKFWLKQTWHLKKTMAEMKTDTEQTMKLE